jgi:hypothetical protein
MKIFLRVVQQLNGWRDLPDLFAAIVLRTPPPPSRPRPRRTAVTARYPLRIPFGCPSDALRMPCGPVDWFLALAP